MSFHRFYLALVLSSALLALSGCQYFQHTKPNDYPADVVDAVAEELEAAYGMRKLQYSTTHEHPELAGLISMHFIAPHQFELDEARLFFRAVLGDLLSGINRKLEQKDWHGRATVSKLDISISFKDIRGQFLESPNIAYIDLYDEVIHYSSLDSTGVLQQVDQDTLFPTDPRLKEKLKQDMPSNLETL